VIGELIIRKAKVSDISIIAQFVSNIREEKYGHLLPTKLLISSVNDQWIKSWIAEKDGGLIGVGFAEDDYIDDLWVHSDYRNQKIGSALLEKLEDQIIKSGHLKGRLRVISENEDAIRFYKRNSWCEANTYRHEIYDFLMVDLIKSFS